MNWGRSTYAEKVDACIVMLKRLRQNIDTFAGMDLTAEKLDGFEVQRKKVEGANAFQEQKKSELKEASVALEEDLDILGDMFKEFKKMVKYKLPQESWVGHGITDKR
jgi:hypothetical protein